MTPSIRKRRHGVAIIGFGQLLKTRSLLGSAARDSNKQLCICKTTFKVPDLAVQIRRLSTAALPLQYILTVEGRHHLSMEGGLPLHRTMPEEPLG